MLNIKNIPNFGYKIQKPPIYLDMDGSIFYDFSVKDLICIFGRRLLLLFGRSQ